MIRTCLLLCLAWPFFLSACDDDAACTDAGECAVGQICTRTGCARCDDDAQCLDAEIYGDEAACVMGSCCQAGQLGCHCSSTVGCELGGTCNEDGFCETCEAGSRSCPCRDDGTCGGDLACTSGVCVSPSCTLGTPNCPCDNGTCDFGLVCSGGGICIGCTPGRQDCVCLGDQTCDPGLSCELGVCVPCTDGARGCACGAGCENGLECVEGICDLVERSCIDLDCLSQGRMCEGEPYAECTRCDAAAGFVPDGQGGCIEVTGACTSSAQCDDGELCLQLSESGPAMCTAPPSCVNLEPAAGTQGAAWDPEAEGCVPCASCAGVAGSTGRIWPTVLGTSCICETQPGWYFDAAFSALAPRPCDEDSDGWVRLPAKQYVESDLASLRENARCTLRMIGAFELQNERGERRRVALTELGLPPSPIGLYESVRTDSQAWIDTDTFMPEIGGRRFLARELNPLTKACATPSADFNGNNVADIAENANSAVGDLALYPFLQVSHFVELHTGWYEPGTPNGVYVIAERQRCDEADFPLSYEAAADGYWRDCSRRRRADFNRLANVPGHDLARFDCSASAGSCPPADTATLVEGAVITSTGRVEDPTDPGHAGAHGACSGAAPTDPYAHWSGMGHHSQFQCVQLVDNLSFPTVPYERERSFWGFDYDPGIDRSGFDASYCVLGAPNDANAHGSYPVSFECTTVIEETELESGQITWALERYHGTANPQNNEAYQYGCINECRTYVNLCPGYNVEPGDNGAGCVADAQGFGEIYCNNCPLSGDPCFEDRPGLFGECAFGVMACDELDEPFCDVADPAPTDEYGDGVDENCDFFDGDTNISVFVVPTSQSPATGTGLWDDPYVGRLSEVLASLDPSVEYVFVEAGYKPGEDQTIEIPGGLQIFGGMVRIGHPDYATYCPLFQLPDGSDERPEFGWCPGVGPDLDPLATTIVSSHPTMLYAESLTEATTISDFIFEQDAVGGSSRYGLVAYNVRTNGTDPALVLRHTELKVEDALPGADPPSLGRAASGEPGLMGELGRDTSTGPPSVEGGAGCPGSNANGGDGGDAAFGPDAGTDGSPGELSQRIPCTGCGANALTPGTGGTGVPARGCLNGLPCPPLPVHAGGDVIQAAGRGNPGVPGYSVFSFGPGVSPYLPEPGEDGLRGGDGAGGGGGGGGGGGQSNLDSWGGSGASGGGGGCGGNGGPGGEPGGSAFGAYLIDSDVSFESCVLEVGAGGDGAEGAFGQDGGLGGQGGHCCDWTAQFGFACSMLGVYCVEFSPPGQRSAQGSVYGIWDEDPQQDDGSNGGAGGKGGDGGNGGAGGPGPGGHSIGLALMGTTAANASPDMRSDDTLVFVSDWGTGGDARPNQVFPQDPGPNGESHETFPCNLDPEGARCGF